MFIRMDVAELSREQMLQMVRDYNELEREGAVGECALRSFAREIRERSGGSSIGIVMLMRDIAFEIFRRFAMENIRHELN